MLLGLLLLLVALALLCRLQYKVKVVKPGREGDWEYDIRIRWLFGIIKRKISSEDVNKELKKEETVKDTKRETGEEVKKKGSKKKRKRAREEGKKEKGHLDRFKGLDIDSILRIIGYTLDLLKKVFAAFRPKRIVVRGLYGAGSPDVTGKVLAVVYGAAAALDISANVEGDFENEVLQLDVRAMGYLRLWAVFVPMVRYILRPEIWRLLFPKRSKQAKKEEKRQTKRKKLEGEENGDRI